MEIKKLVPHAVAVFCNLIAAGFLYTFDHGFLGLLAIHPRPMEQSAFEFVLAFTAYNLIYAGLLTSYHSTSINDNKKATGRLVIGVALMIAAYLVFQYLAYLKAAARIP